MSKADEAIGTLKSGVMFKRLVNRSKLAGSGLRLHRSNQKRKVSALLPDARCEAAPILGAAL